jgi:hypothetical protein
MNEVGRRKPAQGVRIEAGQPTILFLTVCAVRPATWLATEVVQDSLVKIWREADGWLVGNYLLMPDHLHLFCGPRDLQFMAGGEVGGVLEEAVFARASKFGMGMAALVFSSSIAERSGLCGKVAVCAGKSGEEGFSGKGGGVAVWWMRRRVEVVNGPEEGRFIHNPVGVESVVIG